VVYNRVGRIEDIVQINILKKAFVVFIILLSSVIFYSFENAQKVADKIIAPVSNELKRDSCKLAHAYFKNGRFTDKYTDVAWEVMYKHTKEFSSYVRVYVSLSGKIESTNPLDLVERIKIMKDDEKIRGRRY